MYQAHLRHILSHRRSGVKSPSHILSRHQDLLSPHRLRSAPEVVAAITAAIAAMGIKGKVVSIRPRTSERWKNAGRIENISGANRF